MMIGGGAIRRVGDEPDVRKTLSGCVQAPTALNFFSVGSFEWVRHGNPGANL
jgi:hypothetical protein